MNEWLEVLRKACRMMNQNPGGDIEQAYFWLVHKRRPKEVGNQEFACLATSEANGWDVMVDVQIGRDGKLYEFLKICVFPSRGDGVETFAERAAVWLEALESIKGEDAKPTNLRKHPR